MTPGPAVTTACGLYSLKGPYIGDDMFICIV